MTQARASLSSSRPRWTSCAIPTATTPPRCVGRARAPISAASARRPLAVLARACADGPLVEPGTLALTALVDRLEAALDGPGWVDAASGARGRAAGRARRCPRRSPPRTATATGSAPRSRPWAAAAARERAAAGLAALRLIQQVSRPIVAIGADGAGADRAAGSRAGDAPRLRTHLYMDGRACR